MIVKQTLTNLGVGALLGAVMVLIWELSIPNEIGLLLKLLTPFVVFASAISFGFFGLLATIIVSLAYDLIFLSSESLIFAILSSLIIFVPAFFVSIIFHVRIPFRGKLARFSQGSILLALGLISIAVFIAVFLYFSASRLSLQSAIHDYSTSVLMALNGTFDNIGVNSPIPIGILIDFIPSILALAVVIWMFFMFLLAYRISIMAKLYEEEDKNWIYEVPSLQFYLLLIGIIASIACYFFFNSATFIIFNITAIFAGLFFYSGLVWVDLKTSKSIFLKIGFFAVFFLLMFPTILFLVLVGIFRQFSFFLFKFKGKRVK